MRCFFSLITKAVSILCMGTAFFMFGCQLETVVKEPVVEKPVRELYSMAEDDFKAGRYAGAMEKYRLYLKDNPRGERSRNALYRIADINYRNHLYKDALDGFKKVIAEYPDHPETSRVRYELANIYYLTGDFQNSREEALHWLKIYPWHPLKGELTLIVGNSYNALGNKPMAFRWWGKAADFFSGKLDLQDRKDELDDQVADLIARSRPDELKAMASTGPDNVYLPNLYHRLTTIYMEEGSLEEAKNFAMLLVRSSREQSWVTAGRNFLETIFERLEEINIRRGAVGCLLPLNGPFALYGQELLNGIQLGMGLSGKKEGDQDIEIVIRNTNGLVEDTVAGLEELVNEEKVIAILGPLASKPSAAAVKRAQELGVPIITFTQKEGITQAGDMVFRNFLTPSKEIEALLKRSVHEMGMRRFAIFYPENPYGRFFMNLFWDKAEEMGCTLNAVESYKEDETDFAVGIKKMVGLYYPRPASVFRMLKEMKMMEARTKDYNAFYGPEVWNRAFRDELHEEAAAGVMPGAGSGRAEAAEAGYGADSEEAEDNEDPEPIIDFDAVFLPDNPQQVALIAPQFPFYNVFNVPFLGTSLWLSDELLETSSHYVQGAVFPSGFYAGNDSEDVRKFVEEYRMNFESDPGILAANGFDTIRLVKELLASDAVKTRSDFQKELVLHDKFYGVTGKISFDQQGEVEKDPVLLTVHGKRFRLLN